METHAISCNLSLLRTRETRKEACVAKEYRKKDARTQEALRPIDQRARRKTPNGTGITVYLAANVERWAVCGIVSRKENGDMPRCGECPAKFVTDQPVCTVPNARR